MDITYVRSLASGEHKPILTPESSKWIFEHVKLAIKEEVGVYAIDDERQAIVYPLLPDGLDIFILNGNAEEAQETLEILTNLRLMR